MQGSNRVNLEECTAAVCQADSGRSIGTGSRLGPRHYATAGHVVEGKSLDKLRVQDSTGNDFPVDWISLHESEDIAILGVPLGPSQTHADCFHPHLAPCQVGELVFTYGFRPLPDGVLESRIVHGTVVGRYTKDRRTGQRRNDLELNFPSSGGHSGSPILRLDKRNQMVGLITDYLEYDDRHTLSKRTTAAVPFHNVRAWLMNNLSR